MAADTLGWQRICRRFDHNGNCDRFGSDLCDASQTPLELFGGLMRTVVEVNPWKECEAILDCASHFGTKRHIVNAVLSGVP